MNIEGTISWFKNPESGVSAHYVIGRDGREVQMVDDNDKAWHAGVSKMPLTGETNVNDFSIGIELVGTVDSGFTDRQLSTLYARLETLVKKYKIPADRVVGHRHVAPKRKPLCPDGYDGQFPWDKCKAVCKAAYGECNADSSADHRSDA